MGRFSLVVRSGLLFALAAIVPASAQTSDFDASKCAEIDAQTTPILRACTSHQGCTMVVKFMANCPRVKNFLTKLSTVAADPKKVTSNDVFEAAAPASYEPTLLAEIDKFRQLVRIGMSAPNVKSKTYTTATGVNGWYELQLVNGAAEGIGIYFTADGHMFRGQWSKGDLNGQGQLVWLQNDAMYFGPHVNGTRTGSGFLQVIGGTVHIGNFVNGNLEGPATLVYPDGRTQIEIYDANGDVTKSGPIAAKGETAINPLEIERQQQEKAAADAAAAAAAQKAAADAAAAAAAAEKARAEQAFQASLKTLPANQLFAKADELDQAGEADKARQMRRALITRFPKSPLTTIAAKQLGGVASTQPTSASRTSGNTRVNANSSPTQIESQLRSACASQIARMTQVWTTMSTGTVLRDRPDTPAEVAQRIEEHVQGSSTATNLDIEGLQFGIADHEAYRRQNPNGSPLLNDKMNARGMADDDVLDCLRRTRLAQLTGKPVPVSAAAATPVSTGGNNASCGTTPQEAHTNFENAFTALTSQWPNRGDTAGGSRDLYQYSYLLGVEGLKILEKYRPCMDPGEYQVNLDSLQGARDKGKTGCEQLSSAQGTCTPTYPANWGRP